MLFGVNVWVSAGARLDICLLAIYNAHKSRPQTVSFGTQVVHWLLYYRQPPTTVPYLAGKTNSRANKEREKGSDGTRSNKRTLRVLCHHNSTSKWRPLFWDCWRGHRSKVAAHVFILKHTRSYSFALPSVKEILYLIGLHRKVFLWDCGGGISAALLCAD